MKASVQYTDFEGTVAADISDGLGGAYGDDIKSIGKFFNLDEERFKLVGLSIYGTEDFSISLICVDKKRSTEGKEHIIQMSCEVENKKEILDMLFKRLHIVLYDRFDDKYVKMDYVEEVRYIDFHKKDDEKDEEEE